MKRNHFPIEFSKFEFAQKTLKTLDDLASVAGVAEHLVVVLSYRTRVQHFPAIRLNLKTRWHKGCI